ILIPRKPFKAPREDATAALDGVRRLPQTVTAAGGNERARAVHLDTSEDERLGFRGKENSRLRGRGSVFELGDGLATEMPRNKSRSTIHPEALASRLTGTGRWQARGRLPWRLWACLVPNVIAW